MSKASPAEPVGRPASASFSKERKGRASKTRPLEKKPTRDLAGLTDLQPADLAAVAYDEADGNLNELHQKRRRSSTASSRTSSISLPADERQRSHLCAARSDSRADSLCSTQHPATPTGQAATPDPACASPSNHSEAAATVQAATAAAAATVAAAAATIAAAPGAAPPGGEGGLPSPLGSPTPSLPSDAESCCLPPLYPAGLSAADSSGASVSGHPPAGPPRAPACDEGLCYCDVEGFLPGQWGAPLGPHYADIHTEKEYLGLPKRPLKIMTYTNNGTYTETVCVGEDERAAAAAASAEDAAAAGASPPPSPAPSTAAEPATAAAGQQTSSSSSSGGGYQRILWADELIDASYRRKVWYRTDLHTFFSWLRSPSRHRPVKQRTYNARSLGYSEAKRLAFQFHPEECGDADFKKVYYLWKLKMKGKKKEEEAAAAAAASAASCRDEAAAAAAASSGEGAEGADGGAAGGAAAGAAALQQPPQSRRGWGAKRRNTRQRAAAVEAGGEQQQQQQGQAPPVSAMARDVLSGNANFCFSLSTPRQLRHLQDFGTISCAGLDEVLFPADGGSAASSSGDAAAAAASEKAAEKGEAWRVVEASTYDFGAAGCITFRSAYEEEDPQAEADSCAPNTETLDHQHYQHHQQQQQQRQQQDLVAYSQEGGRHGQREAPSEHSPLQQLQRRTQQRQTSQAAMRRRLGAEEQLRRVLAQQQEERQQQEAEQLLLQQELEQQRHQRQQVPQRQEAAERHQLHQQLQRREQQKQLWQQQLAEEVERQLFLKHRQDLLQQVAQHLQSARPPQQQQLLQQQQQQPRDQPLGAGGQKRDSQLDQRVRELVLQHEREVQRQRELLRQQHQYERQAEQPPSAALAQRHQEIAAVLQQLNPQARQRLEALLRSGVLGRISHEQPALC
ncbi:hypothetical protein Efla_001517 [Eimeria flavescens]